MSQPEQTSWLNNPMVLLQSMDLSLYKNNSTANWNNIARAFLLLLLLGTLGYYPLGPSWPVLLITLYALYYGPFIVGSMQNNQQEQVVEKFANEGTDSSQPTGFAEILPTKNASPYTNPNAKNPFMNILLDELKYNTNRPAAAPVGDPLVKASIEDYFQVQWVNDPTDVFGKTQGQRQFYTMPSTTIPNDRANLQNWLYAIPGKTCKEGGKDQCYPGTNGGAVPWLSKPN
jgi:hypothetical protein